MILYQGASRAGVRVGQFDLAGRRVAARASPYEGEVGAPSWRFDPVERRLVARQPSGTVVAGPPDSESWRSALSRAPAGAVLVGPGDAAEEIYGAYRAATDGAALAGRGIYLLDPTASVLPERDGNVFVLLFALLPGDPPPAILGESRRRGLTGGVLFPLIPGWTAQPELLEGTVEAAAEAGASFVAGVAAAEDGPARRSIVEARALLDRQGPEDFFERIHHEDWSAAIEQARCRLKEACEKRGLASLPPRPVGFAQPAINAAAAGRLEEKAEALAGRNEHHASLLLAAARWIDEWGRDLAPVVKEGNFRKIFPFSEETAREAEEALGAEP